MEAPAEAGERANLFQILKRNEEEQKMKFIKEDRYANQNRIKIEMEVHDESTLEEVLEEFLSFLRACGYVIEYNKTLDLVDVDE